MNISLKLVSQILILGIIISLGYLSFINDFKNSLVAFSTLLILGLVIDLGKSEVFKRVISILLIATLARILFSYLDPKQVALVYIAQLLTTFGIFFIVQELFKEVELHLVFSIYGVLSLVVLLANALLIYEIVALINKFNLGLSHTAFDFIFTLVKTFILSFGLIGYFFSIWKSKKVTLLFVSIVALLIGDLFDTLNYLLFIDDLFSEGLFLQYMFSILGLFLFYKFCSYPNDEVLI